MWIVTTLDIVVITDTPSTCSLNKNPLAFRKERVSELFYSKVYDLSRKPRSILPYSWPAVHPRSRAFCLVWPTAVSCSWSMPASLMGGISFDWETIWITLASSPQKNVKWKSLSSVQLCDPHRLLNSPGQNTGVGSVSLRKGMFKSTVPQATVGLAGVAILSFTEGVEGSLCYRNSLGKRGSVPPLQTDHSQRAGALADKGESGLLGT